MTYIVCPECKNTCAVQSIVNPQKVVCPECAELILTSVSKVGTIVQLQRLLSEHGRNLCFNVQRPDKIFIHLIEEVGELAREMKFISSLQKSGIEKFSKDIADVVILSCFLASSVGINLEEAVRREIEENVKARKFEGNLQW